jgi:hypothetical protein
MSTIVLLHKARTKRQRGRNCQSTGRLVPLKAESQKDQSESDGLTAAPSKFHSPVNKRMQEGFLLLLFVFPSI